MKSFAQKNLAKPYSATGLLYAAMVLFTLGCAQPKKGEAVAEKQIALQQPPQKTLLSQLSEKDKPRVVMLDTVPKPSFKKTTSTGSATMSAL